METMVAQNKQVNIDQTSTEMEDVSEAILHKVIKIIDYVQGTGDDKKSVVESIAEIDSSGLNNKLIRTLISLRRSNAVLDDIIKVLGV